MTERPLAYLLRNGNFMLMWWAGFVSWVGNYMLFIALPVYVYDQTGSTLATSFSVMANALPMIVVGQLAGVLVDRWDYRHTLVAANTALVGVTLLFLAVLTAPWWVVIPIAFLQSSVGQFIGPAENALLPTLVDETRLGAANSLNALNNNLARLVGPAAGGLLVASVGFGGVVLANALTYLLAALLVLGVRAPEVVRQASAETNLYRRLLSEWRTGLSAVRRNRLLSLSFAVSLIVGLGEGTISTLMAPFVKVMLGGGGLELGLIMSAQAVGGITGGLLLTSFADRIPTIRLLGWGGLLSGVLLFPLLNYPLVYPVLWPSLVLVAIAGLPFAMFGSAQMTLLQTEAEPQVRGRVFSAYFAVFGTAQLVGMLGSGLLGDVIGVMLINTQTVAYLLAGLIVLAVSTRGLNRTKAREAA
jgi:MFS family permease